MTGDKRYEPIIDEILSAKNLKIERQWLSDNISFEMPYGRAWFLRLALEYERHYSNGRLLPLADFVAATLMTNYGNTRPDPLGEEYENSAWALVNLLDYFQFRVQAKQAELVKTLIRESFLAPAAKCNSLKDRPGFMAICTNWAWVASRVMGREDFSIWIAKFLPASQLPAPVTDPGGAHEYGINFSRAWGLWEIYSATARPEYVGSYVDHVQAALASRKNWDGEYRSIGHWVPQFGMFAIQPLFGAKFR